MVKGETCFLKDSSFSYNKIKILETITNVADGKTS